MIVTKQKEKNIWFSSCILMTGSLFAPIYNSITTTWRDRNRDSLMISMVQDYIVDLDLVR